MNSKNLAYWLGVCQTDGFLKKQYVKSKNQTRYYICLTIGHSSIEMLEKFMQISKQEFNREGSIYYDQKRASIQYKFRCNRLLEEFEEKELNFKDPPEPPKWILNNSELFGAYLAGIIDGDGNIEITRPKYPQCKVRIYSSKQQIALSKAIEDKLKCKTNCLFFQRESKIENRNIFGSWWTLYFNISPKNFKFVSNYILNEIAIKRKGNKIKEFLKRRAVGENRTPV